MRRGRNETGHSTSSLDRRHRAFALLTPRLTAHGLAVAAGPVDVDVTRRPFTVNETWSPRPLIASPLMTDLTDAAFGAHPGRWPLPGAATPAQLWLRAVAAGGQGRYGAALADLDSLARTRPRGALASLADSTRASFLRQLGGHRVARGWDARAWATAGDDAAAGTDALVGLAADALGVGRFALSGRLLARAEDVLRAGAIAEGRLPVRLTWVRAELAMFTGDGATAVDHARRAVDLASDLGSVRHDVKSRVVLAAALCAAGDVDGSRVQADDALTAADRHGLVPLRWAVACLLADVGSSVHPPSRIAAVRDASADLIAHRGGTWSAR